MTKKLLEGDPIIPVAEIATRGIHERDYFIHGALSSSEAAWKHTDNGKWVFSEQDIADRACRLAAAVMERKEHAP